MCAMKRRFAAFVCESVRRVNVSVLTHLRGKKFHSKKIEHGKMVGMVDQPVIVFSLWSVDL